MPLRFHIVDTPLEASSTTAGALISSYRFAIPEFQREYAWTRDEVEEFWRDLRDGLDAENYFLGLVILTGTGLQKDVVDGQQRLLTLTLLAAALYRESISADRRALAERLHTTFLRAIDFATDEELPRIELSSEQDTRTLLAILTGDALPVVESSSESTSAYMLSAYRLLSDSLKADLVNDPFKRLGLWADFITNHLYFAVFIHPDPGSAYRVFEIVNTRGRELTTADLLKSFILSQTAERKKEERYREWQAVSEPFRGSPNLFVQFIRHSVTVRRGHILPKDLYDVLSGRSLGTDTRIGPDQLMKILTETEPLYLQMVDPTSDGPASEAALGVFSALNRLSVISVRPMLLAMATQPNADNGMEALLRLVVRRIVVGNLGTGNVERRLGNAAQRIYKDGGWEAALRGLADLDPPKEDFVSQLHRRSLNKNVLAFIRQSILQESISPEPRGFLHLIMPRDADWPEFAEDRASYWASTIGNTILTHEERRPQGSATWAGVRDRLLPLAIPDEWRDKIESAQRWDENAVSSLGRHLASVAAEVWYS